MNNAILKTGQTFRWMSNKAHVRGFVDDQVCFRFWLKHRRRWHYQCEPIWLITHHINSTRKLEAK